MRVNGGGIGIPKMELVAEDILERMVSGANGATERGGEEEIRTTQQLHQFRKRTKPGDKSMVLSAKSTTGGMAKMMNPPKMNSIGEWIESQVQRKTSI